MAIEKELDRSKELLFRKPNPFEWSSYKKHLHKGMAKRIMKNPYSCDECGDTYNKDDLYKIESEWFCQNCLCSG